jgi:hypothetical protein
MGDSTYDDYRLENSIEFQDADGTAIAVGSIFSEGSLVVITAFVALLALIASGVSIFLVVYYNKGKAVPATINVADKFDDEES